MAHEERAYRVAKELRRDIDEDQPPVPNPIGFTTAHFNQAIRQARAEALGKSMIKLVATQFYFWWANQPETNTYQGFDAWWEAEGERFVENLHALKELSDGA